MRCAQIFHQKRQGQYIRRLDWIVHLPALVVVEAHNGRLLSHTESEVAWVPDISQKVIVETRIALHGQKWRSIDCDTLLVRGDSSYRKSMSCIKAFSSGQDKFGANAHEDLTFPKLWIWMKRTTSIRLVYCCGWCYPTSRNVGGGDHSPQHPK